MRKRTILCTILAVTQIFLVLSGCGAASASVSNHTASTTEQIDRATMPEHSDADSKIKTEEAELTLWKVWPPFVSNYDPSDAYQFRYLEQQLNVKMEVQTTSTDTASETFNLMVASGDMTDLIESATRYYSGGGSKAMDDGILYDLTPYLSEYAPDYYRISSADSIGKRMLYDDQGRTSQFVGFFDNDMIISKGLWIRQDWLDAQALEIPSTLTELDNVLRAFSSEYGAKDTYAMRDSCEPFIYTAFDAHPDWYIKDGIVTYGKTENSYQDYLQKMNDWYEAGFFSSDFITSNDSTAPLSALVTAGETGVVDADKTLISDIFAADPSGSINMQPVPPITQDRNTKIDNQFFSTKVLVSSTVSISTSCESVETAVAYINAGFKESNKIAMNYGEENVTFTYDENREPHYTDLIVNNADIPGSFASIVYVAPGIPVLRDLELYNSVYTYEAQLIADDVFTSKDNGNEDSIFPEDYLSFTTDESTIIAKYTSDLDTYLNEVIAQFVVGAKSVDSDFDDFVKALNETYGIPELQKVYQAAYERFNANA